MTVITLTTLNKRIGKEVRFIRTSSGLTLQAVATLCGVTYQQWRKYETGKNRINAARLLLFLQATGTPPEVFFNNCSPDTTDKKDDGLRPLRENDLVLLKGLYDTITDKQIKESLLRIMKHKLKN